MPEKAGRRSAVRAAVLSLLLAAPLAMRLAAQAAPAPTLAPAPVPADLPRWPKDAAPAPAAVQWDSHGLRISAKNSSLKQILTEVASRIGAKVEGIGADERVFGEYGPGPAKEVLGALLEGSAYNVMLIGDQGQGTPREIVLSARSASSGTKARGAQPQQPLQNSADDEADSSPIEDTPVQQPPLPRPPMNPQNPNPQPPQNPPPQ